MHFIKQTANFDLGDTPIENIFINDFMPMANGTYVKVYLLGYKFANDKDSSLRVTHQTIAKHLSIPLADVYDAWNFWEQKGIIKKHILSPEDSTEYVVEFLSLKQLYIDNNFKPINLSTQDNDPSFSCSPKDIVEAQKVPEINDMFYQIKQIVRRGLSANEMMQVLEWIYEYGMDVDLIVQMFSYCVEHKKIKNIRYISAVARNWYDQGITNIEKLDGFLEKTDIRYSIYHKIFKSLGFGFREPSDAEKKSMNIWIDEWNFSLDMILKACENSKKTSNPNINYIHSILNAWKNDNVKTPEDIPIKKETRPMKKNIRKSAPNRFHNFEQRTAKYSKDELEEILKRKNK